MKLQNKKTGEIGELYFEPDKEYHFTVVTEDPADMRIYKELSLLNDEWEGYKEEPKAFWCIDYDGGIISIKRNKGTATDELMKAIGNYFETLEEAEKAVQKLKAWKRLKGHNLRIERGQRIFVNTDNKLTSQKPLFVVDTYEEVEDDLDLLFGGEE